MNIIVCYISLNLLLTTSRAKESRVRWDVKSVGNKDIEHCQYLCLEDVPMSRNYFLLNRLNYILSSILMTQRSIRC